VDTAKQMKRWQWKVSKATLRSADGTLTPAPEQVETIDEMVGPDGHFVLRNGFLPRGSTHWQRSLVILPASQTFMPPSVDNDSFDPFLYMYLDDQPVSTYIERMRPYWSSRIPGTFKIVRQGSIVVFQCTTSDRTHTLLSSLSVDLDRGGNVVDRFDDGGRHPTTISITYAKVSDAWLPSKYTEDAVSSNNDRHRRDVTFHNLSFNQPLAADEFTIEKMGVEVGTRVSDHRREVFYKYGREAQTLRHITTQPAANAGDGVEGL